jgi:hypothetical protein
MVMVVKMVEMTPLEFLFCGVIFTAFGWYWGYRNSAQSMHTIVEKVVDGLIDDGFIKTRLDKNGETELLRHWEDA